MEGNTYVSQPVSTMSPDPADAHGRGRSRLRRGVRLATVAALITAATAVTFELRRNRADHAGKASNIVVTVLSDPRQITLPLDHYQLSTAQTTLINRATATLAARCMRTFRLTPVIDPGQITDNAGANLGNQRRYGPLDASLAARYGVRPAPQPPARTRPPAAGPSGDQLAVWSGTGPATFGGQPIPAGGCSGAAERDLAHGVPTADFSLPAKLSAQAWHDSRSDPIVTAAFSTWHGCMAGSGFSYTQPMDVVNDPRFRTTAPTAQEKHTAVADVACMRLHNVAGIWLAADSAQQVVLIKKNQRALDAIVAVNHAMLSSAQTLLSTP
ncbi:MAG: hypothetical protein JWN95_975 [Frankiales bacterium]|nr:hypothetical protein [Frankiales bacterium]